VADSRFVHEALPGRVLFGAGRLAEVAEESRRLGNRFLLIAGWSERPAAEQVHADLGGACAAAIVGVRPHVPLDAAEEGRRTAAEARADCIVVIGGGSAIGLAKAIALTERLPIVAVPTTYSGSEQTPTWGITDGGRKTRGRDRNVQPRSVVYDPKLTLSLPVDVSAASGMNAIAHCVEALWSERTDPLAAAVAEEAIRTLAPALRRVVANPEDLDARSAALRGAWLAGTALAAGGIGLHHTICHVLGGSFDVPHAQAHAVVLPYVTAYHATVAPEALDRVARALDAMDAVEGLLELERELGVPTSLAELGLSAEHLESASERIARDAPPHPRRATRAEIRGLLERAYDGADPLPSVLRGNGAPEHGRHVRLVLERSTFFASMAAFPTGVTVVTTLDAEGAPCGLTCNAFMSVSAEPPLVLVSIDRASQTLPALQAARRFVVNFLAENRGELATMCASKSSGKFLGINWTASAHGGLPILHEDSIAHVVCDVVKEIPAGDHVLMIGRVQEAKPPAADAVPLLYFRRTYDQWPVVGS